MLISCIFGFLSIIIYTVYIIYKGKEIPQSLSATVYRLSEKNKWIFSLAMFVVTFSIAPQLFTVIIPQSQVFAFFTFVGLLGVGADPLVRNEKNIVHYVSAIICGVSSQILIYMNNYIYLGLWGIYVIYTLIREFSGKNMFIAEMIMTATITLLCFG